MGVPMSKQSTQQIQTWQKQGLNAKDAVSLIFLNKYWAATLQLPSHS